MTSAGVPAQINISPRMEAIIRYMLDHPEAEHATVDICKALKVQSGGVAPYITLMYKGGWLDRRPDPNGPRVFYRFTAGTAAMLRKVTG